MRGEANEFFEFARSAQPGDARVYGRGDRPPREAVAAMRDLVDAGVLIPVSKREGSGRLFMVQRGSAPMTRVGQRPRRGRVRRRIRKTALSMVFDCVVAAARRGEACPTNDELAQRCRLTGKLQASYRMRQLVAQGRIALEDHSPYGRRVVTILTGPHAGKQTIEAEI